MAENIIQRIENLEWSFHIESLHENGYAILPKILSEEECEQLAGAYDDHTLYRSTINMKRYQFGSGEYKYFNYPLPDIIADLRQAIYPYLT